MTMPPGSLKDRLNHPSFTPQPSSSECVWRYMDLAKLIWLLDKRKLHFPRADRLGDPLEGSLPRKVAEGYKKNHPAAAPIVEEYLRQYRRTFYVNCWRLGGDESEAMWRIYCPSDMGVALRTTYGRLARWVEPHPVWIGKVRYIDFEQDVYPHESLVMFDIAMHKRRAFAHETEVRMLYESMKHQHLGAPPSPAAFEFEWEPDLVSDRIYVNPYAPTHCSEAVRAAVRHFAPGLEVMPSSMNVDPYY